METQLSGGSLLRVLIGFAKWTSALGWGTASNVAGISTVLQTALVPQSSAQLASGNTYLFCLSQEGQVLYNHWIGFSSSKPGPHVSKCDFTRGQCIAMGMISFGEHTRKAGIFLDHATEWQSLTLPLHVDGTHN